LFTKNPTCGFGGNFYFPINDKMKKEIITITLLLASLLWGTRYLHRTGKVQLRVDDVYPLGFVEFIYQPLDSSDVLWRAFLALNFSLNDNSVIYHGRANDEGELADISFHTVSTLQLFEDTLFDTTMIIDSTDTAEYDTTYEVDTIISSAESRCAFATSDFRLQIDQIVNSNYNYEPYIEVMWILTNTGEDNLMDGVGVFHFDGDVPDVYFDDDIAIGFPEKVSACQMASSEDEQCVGFIWLAGGMIHQLENTLDWFHYGVDTDSLLSLIQGEFWFGSEYCSDTAGSGDTICPVWVDSLYGDVGIGVLFSIPNLASAETETLSFFLAGAPDPDSFAAIADSIAKIKSIQNTNISDKPTISINPNPFNSICVISCPTANKFQIIDLNGRMISTINTETGTITYNPGNIPSGIYFICGYIPDGVVYKKLIYIR